MSAVFFPVFGGQRSGRVVSTPASPPEGHEPAAARLCATPVSCSKTCRLNGASKLPVGVNLSVNGCQSLCVARR